MDMRCYVINIVRVCVCVCACVCVRVCVRVCEKVHTKHAMTNQQQPGIPNAVGIRLQTNGLRCLSVVNLFANEVKKPKRKHTRFITQPDKRLRRASL